MHVRRFATSVEVFTPAKINLFLEVLARRPDGYHDIETLLAAVTLYDRLIFTPHEHDEIALDVRWGLGQKAAARELLCSENPCAEIPGGPENLAFRAAALVRDRGSVRRGAAIRLMKRIPAAAGLGGASSDAAAALVAANAAWSLNWSREKLLELAAELGSDVPFFLSRGMAVCRGRGEQIEPMPASRLHVVIVRPPVGLSTPRVYQLCQPAKKPVGVAGLATAVARGDAAAVGRLLVNTLEPAAAQLTPWIEKLNEAFATQDVLGHQMSGSGSSCFGLCRSARHARRVAARLRSMNIGAVFAATTAVAT